MQASDVDKKSSFFPPRIFGLTLQRLLSHIHSDSSINTSIYMHIATATNPRSHRTSQSLHAHKLQPHRPLSNHREQAADLLQTPQLVLTGGKHEMQPSQALLHVPGGEQGQSCSFHCRMGLCLCTTPDTGTRCEEHPSTLSAPSRFK